MLYLLFLFLSNVVGIGQKHEEKDLQAIVRMLESDFEYDGGSWLLMDIKSQKLYLVIQEEIIDSYKVSTSKYGIGSESGSNKTPLGVHRIKHKIGKGAKPAMIFKGRVNTHKPATIITDPIDTQDDFVTSRIMWLEGLEDNVNRGRNVDSYSRYIYIHGTHEEGLIGTPASHGCIRMKNNDVIELFDLVKEGTLVVIMESLH